MSCKYCGCSRLTSVTIGNSVTSIGRGAFESCSSLTSIVVASNNTKYDSRDNCNAIIETATNTLIVGCQTTTIPESVTSIGNNAFNYCTGLTSITIGNNVTSIGSGAFANCSGLTSITIPESVTSIGSGAFSECTGLTSITIPNGLTRIVESTFYNCRSLTSITIPNSVTSIGSHAFWNCSNLKDVYCYPENVPTTSSYAFDGTLISSATLHVPIGSVSAYRAKSPWSGFGNIVAIE